MKKNKNVVTPYPIPKGFYIPVDPQVKKKRNTTPVIIAVCICLVLAVIFSTVAIGFLALVGKTAQTIANSDFTPLIQCMEHFGEKGMKFFEENMESETAYLFRYAVPYEKSGINFSGETMDVVKDPFSFKLSKHDYQISKKGSSTIYLYNDEQGSIRVEVDDSLYYQNDASWRETLADEPFLLSEAEYEARVAAFTKMFGYNPMENVYNFDRACFTTRYWELNYDFPEAGKTLSAFLHQKYVMEDNYETVFTRNTDTYRGFVLTWAGENDVDLLLDAYLPDIDDAQYYFRVHCTGAYANEAYAILNSVAFVPEAKEVTLELLKEVES